MVNTNYTAKKRAVVIGGSVAGLATAEVLSRYFSEVVIVERDHFPDGGEFRKGVPQGRQPHILLKRGLLELEALFPGFTDDWQKAGAISNNFGFEVEWFAFGGWRPHYEPGLVCYASTRPLLELVIRRRVKANPAVVFTEAAEVIALVANKTNTCVTGVGIRTRDAHQTEEVLEADLVVDASGRETHTPEWLESLGYPCPKRVVVNAFPGYASRIYERPESFTGKTIYIQPHPPHVTRGALILPLENNQMHVVAIGMSKDYPPSDEQGYKAFLSGLSNKQVYDVIKNAEPVTPLAGYRGGENIWHRYDQQPSWPDNFVALGDASLAFNPVYGQGMTTAVLSAVCLNDCLTKQENIGDLKGFALRFQKELARVQSFPWQLATGEDMRWSPATDGIAPTPGLMDSMVSNFFKKVMVASTKDPVVTAGLYEVMNMVATPSVFFRPAMLSRVLRAS